MPNSKTRPRRSQWSSQFAFILVATGAAVGLGNIWKLPYMAGSQGGGAFVLIYIACILLIGLPVLLAELLVGRRGRQSTVGAIRLLATETSANPHWQWVCWLCSLTLLLVLSFYSVVSGWSLGYLVHTWHGDFTGLSPLGIHAFWEKFLANPAQLILWHSLFMIITFFVVVKGVHNGLERAAKILMPLLFVLLIMLVGYGMGSQHFMQAVHFLLDPDFSKLTSNAVIAALGHAFFTLAVGGGTMLVYGSYLSQEASLGHAVLWIALLDVLVAILAGLAIFPIVFAYQLDPKFGPGLMFEVLPIAFSKMEGGHVLGGSFFLLLLLAAWTSSISLAEPLVALLSERYKFSRLKASLIVGILAWLIGIASLLSLNVWKTFTLFGQWSIFSAITDVSTNILLPIGGLFFAFFTGFVLHRRITREELAFKNERTYNLWRFLVRFVAPCGILVILLYPTYSFLKGLLHL